MGTTQNCGLLLADIGEVDCAGRIIIQSDKESPFKCSALRGFNHVKYAVGAVYSALPSVSLQQ